MLAEVEEEYAEAIVAADKNIQHTLHKYSRGEAEERVRSCSYLPGYYLDLANILPEMDDINGMTQSYDIFDIRKVLTYLVGKKVLDKYPDEGPGSDELKKLIDAHRDDMNKEYQQATSAASIKTSLHEYSSMRQSAE
ncbi:hypothetical protein OS493_039741 [Desmophyllum pertusum]|uniref:Uncharacterized protein n=1 Tax=Desmophyllum pertusum TaxID=174260 RepID=A0A9W9ZUI2_9CNID|nr:hypothetical protein OS493_039741 [Desmophyllum pertusum]